MFSSTILDVIIGLVAVFLAVSLLTSAVTEAISTLIGLRAKTLLAGIKQLLNDPGLTGLAGAVYRHGLVNPLSDGSIGPEGKPTVTPSYIDSAHFASALIDSVQRAAGQAAALDQAIGKIADPQVRNTLEVLYQRAAGKADAFHIEVARWFDTSMDRVSGIYKRWAKLLTFVIGLLAAFALNADPVHIGETLWQRPVAAADLAKIQPAAPTDTITPTQQTNALIQQIDSAAPLLGWDGFTAGPRGRGLGLALTIMGWLITAGTTCSGRRSGSMSCNALSSCAARASHPPGSRNQRNGEIAFGRF
jgi:hypothetical protein